MGKKHLVQLRGVREGFRIESVPRSGAAYDREYREDAWYFSNGASSEPAQVALKYRNAGNAA